MLNNSQGPKLIPKVRSHGNHHKQPKFFPLGLWLHTNIAHGAVGRLERGPKFTQVAPGWPVRQEQTLDQLFSTCGSQPFFMPGSCADIPIRLWCWSDTALLYKEAGAREAKPFCS